MNIKYEIVELRIFSNSFSHPNHLCIEATTLADCIKKLHTYIKRNPVMTGEIEDNGIFIKYTIEYEIYSFEENGDVMSLEPLYTLKGEELKKIISIVLRKKKISNLLN